MAVRPKTVDPYNAIYRNYFHKQLPLFEMKEGQMKKILEPKFRDHPVVIPDRPGNLAPRAHWSQRKYPERTCANPLCQYGGLFHPHDKRQIHCCRQCGIDHRNDLRAEANRTTYLEEKIMRETDRLLEQLYENHFDGKYCLIHVNQLQLHKVDLSYFVQSAPNKTTGMKALWLYKFGTERHHENKDWYYILKRKSKNV